MRASVSPDTKKAVAFSFGGDQPGNLPKAGKNSTSSIAVNASLQPLYFTVEQIKIGGSDAVDNVYRWAWAVAGNYTPLVLLLYFNVRLCWRIYFSMKMRGRFRRHCQASRSSNILTITLVAIVIMFFILVAPSETMLALKNNITMDKITSRAIEDIFNLLQTFNFAVNFILYSVINPYFRRSLKYILLCNFHKNVQNTQVTERDFQTSLIEPRK